MYNNHGPTLYTPVFPTAGKSNPLSHLHLALASIPAELAPSSRPPSPGSKARRQVVYNNIRAAYNAAGGQTSHTSWSQVYRLVDMTCTRSRFKKSATRVERKDPEKDIPWILAETEEEWLEWEKAREKLKPKLRRTDTDVVGQQGHPSASSTSSKQVNLRDKVTSWKAQVDRSFHGDEEIIHDPKSLNPTTARGSQQSSAKKRASSLDFPVVKPSTLKAHKDDKARQKTSECPAKPDPPRKPDLDRLRSPAVEVLPTSANREPPPEQKRDAFNLVRLSLDMSCTWMTLTVGLCQALIPASIPRAVTSTPKKRCGVPDGPSGDLRPPSPLRAGTRSIPPLGLTTPESQEAQRAAAKRRFQPLSPPTTGDEPADSGPLPSAKRQKTTTSLLHTTRPVSPLPLRQGVPATPMKKRGVFGSGDQTHRTKRTPVRPLGAAEGFEGVGDVGVIGRVTPKKRERSLTPLLASSHKVMQRPRPPLKGSRVSPFDTIEIDNEDLMPRGSSKAYFSSPVSSTSSTSTLRKNKGSPSQLALGHSNPNFTIDPEAFAPLFTSTQNGQAGDGSGGGGRALSRKETGSSTGLLKFNSQFDVDKNVEDAMALLERDVDADNWFVDLTAGTNGLK